MVFKKQLSAHLEKSLGDRPFQYEKWRIFILNLETYLLE
jgi:hypothetical protein